MAIIKLKILNQAGHTLTASPAGENVALVYAGRYQPGDWVALEGDGPVLNPYDSHETKGIYPHAQANVETRGEAVFAARNAIDGVFANWSHGEWPYQSWGINMRQKICKIRIPQIANQLIIREMSGGAYPPGIFFCY